MKENSIKTLNDIYHRKISFRKRGKSFIKIDNRKIGGIDVQIAVPTEFNWLQKKLWKYLLNIDIKDIREDK